MAQQARPKDMGQMEFLRAQLITQSTEVRMIPSRAASRSIASLSRRSNNSAGPAAIGSFVSGFVSGFVSIMGFDFIFSRRRGGFAATVQENRPAAKFLPLGGCRRMQYPRPVGCGHGPGHQAQ